LENLPACCLKLVLDTVLELWIQYSNMEHEFKKVVHLRSRLADEVYDQLFAGITSGRTSSNRVDDGGSSYTRSPNKR